jgi:WhiB family redox-sensing transcriptional regulator
VTDTVLGALSGGDRAWMSRAACLGCGTVSFFPSSDESPGPALAVCSGCPVSGECLDYALRHRIVDGVWGATDERTRKRMLRRGGKTAA